MLEKGISGFEVEQTILFGDVVQNYESDKPYPSKLLLKFVKERPIHVVVARNQENSSCIIITCYLPDPEIWNEDFKTKRKL
jgi:hypothetical protein